MLEAAREQRADGIDVLVGYVETHGRAETDALLEGLEILPLRSVEYRGTALREFDLDGALARRPALIVVDELAHTNVPGSRHAKRWQDVVELLDAGIDVYTTVNVQHVESLNDVVAKITGVVVRETVPDSVLEQADEVELIDLPPDDLLERFKDGKVYMPDQAQEAVRNFFRKGNLIALRELALRRRLWTRILIGSIVDAIVQGSGDIDIYVISAEREQGVSPVLVRRRAIPPEWAPYVWALTVVALSSGIAWLTLPFFELANLVMVYLLGIVV